MKDLATAVGILDVAIHALRLTSYFKVENNFRKSCADDGPIAKRHTAIQGFTQPAGLGPLRYDKALFDEAILYYTFTRKIDKVICYRLCHYS